VNIFKRLFHNKKSSDDCFFLTPFKVQNAKDSNIIYLASGVLHEVQKEQNDRVKWRSHRLQIKRIRSTADLSKYPPISERTTIALLEAERRYDQKVAFQRFFGVTYIFSKLAQRGIIVPNQINLSHTLDLGYYLSTGTYVEILKVSFNANTKNYDDHKEDFIAKVIGEYIADWLKSYQSKIVNGVFVQHHELVSISLKNKIIWLTRIFSEYYWYYSGERFR